jgi:hypothetical protein
VATWPTVEELKQRLDITSEDWDDQLGRVLAASIEETKLRVGDWVEGVDVPDDALVQSALERAVEYGSIGEGAAVVKSRQLLYGHRKRFGTA